MNYVECEDVHSRPLYLNLDKLSSVRMATPNNYMFNFSGEVYIVDGRTARGLLSLWTEKDKENELLKEAMVQVLQKSLKEN